MPSQACLNNVASEPPPYNVICTPGFCEQTSFARGVHCSKRGLPMDTPVLSWDPNLNGGQACYCCCSCFALGTPLEASPGKFALIEDLNRGDMILATGVDMKWKPTKVKSRTGDTDTSMIPGFYYVEYRMAGETDNRHLLVTPDHLFLMQKTKTLKKVQYLIPGDALMAADGQAAIVQFAVSGEHHTAVQSIEMHGPVNMKTLDNHLLNSNGVVTADYAVQVLSELDYSDVRGLLVPAAEEEHEVGSDEYHSRHGGRAQAFIDDPSKWPRGFVPHHSHTFKVPAYAKGYLTPRQEQAVFDNGDFNPFSNATGRPDMLYLFKQWRAIYPDVTCILDWQERRPNAYAWQNAGQKFLLVTGGLVRLKKFFIEGLSVLTASLQVSLQEESCVCQWDYTATTTVLRDAWPDTVLAQLVPNGIKQVQYLFSLAGTDTPTRDPCNFPTMDCRIKSYWAGFSFFNLPDCAGVWPQYLNIQAAYASIDNSQIIVTFNDALNVASATDLANYTLSPAATISKATVEPDNTVTLQVKGLTAAGYYVLLLNNITSLHGAPLGPDQNQVIVRSN